MEAREEEESKGKNPDRPVFKDKRTDAHEPIPARNGTAGGLREPEPIEGPDKNLKNASNSPDNNEEAQGRFPY